MSHIHSRDPNVNFSHNNPQKPEEEDQSLNLQDELVHGTTPRTVDPKDLSEGHDINLPEGLPPPPHIPLLKEDRHLTIPNEFEL